MIDLIKEIKKEKFHAVNFYFNNVQYTFSGWWLLEWDGGEKDYMSKRDFLEDKIFDGMTIEEIQNQITDIQLEFEP